MIWWKVLMHFEAHLEPIDVVRATPNFVYIRDNRGHEWRLARVSTYGAIVETFAEAKAYVMDRAVRRVETAKANYERAKAALAHAEALTEPEAK